MPAPATGNVLSGSTNGLPIIVVATATAGTLIHTAVAGTSGFDAIWLFASNVTAAPATLTIEWGGVAAPGSHLVNTYYLSPNSPPVPIAVGQRLMNGLIVRAFSGTASAINITGWYTRISL
jgi:hypothetical protein